MTPDTLCPNCMKASPVRTDPEMVRCEDCGWETDYYEAAKQFDNYKPRCFTDGRPATHYAPVKRRFFCAGCAPRVGLGDKDKL